MKKKKVLATTLAATLVLGSVAGLPLSPKGIWSALGIQTASAQGLSNEEIQDTLADVYAQLTAEEKAAIDAARVELAKVDANDHTLVSEVWAKIVDASEARSITIDYAKLTHVALINLIKDLGIFYDPSFSGLQAAIEKQSNRNTLAELARVAGFGSGNDFVQADVAAFAGAVEASLSAEIAKKTPTELFLLAADNEAIKTLLATAVDLAVTNHATLSISKLIEGLGLTGMDLITVHNKLAAIVDPEHAAEKALIAGFVRTQSEFTTGMVADNGRTLQVTLKVAGLTVPSSLIEWTISNNKITPDATGAHFLLSSSVASDSKQDAVVSASVMGKLIFQGGMVSMTYTAPSTNPDPDPGQEPGPVVTPPADEVKGPDKEKAEEIISKGLEKLDDLLQNPNAGDGLKKAREAVEEAIREAAQIDVSASIKVEGGVAKPSLDIAKLEDVFKAVKDIAAAAKDKLKAAAPDAKPAKVTATLNLGTVDADAAEIPLSKELVEKAKENGVEAIAIQVNGVTLAIDLDQIGEGTNLTIKKKNKSEATGVTQLAVASDVYEFTFETDGAEQSTFTKPVELRLPVASVDGLDSDLLVFAKIEDNGQLTFKGGTYDAATGEFKVKNKSFSTYAILENKVEFADIASVKDWAGRQIAVAAAKGILEGREDGKFVPDAKVTRAEFAKMIVKTFGLEDASATESFTDVADSEWFKPYVAAAVKAGLVNGRSDAKFEPNATITRAEMATIASRALTTVLEFKDLADADTALKAFADADAIHATLKNGVALAADQGLVIGEEDAKFNPNDDSTRAQAAVVIHRLLNK